VFAAVPVVVGVGTTAGFSVAADIGVVVAAVFAGCFFSFFD